MLAFGLGSLAGIPPLGGFIAKLFLLFAAFQAGLYSLLFISICGVVISIYYYFIWIREVFFSVESGDQNNVTVEFSTADSVVLAILVVAIVLVGVYPGVLPLMQ